MSVWGSIRKARIQTHTSEAGLMCHRTLEEFFRSDYLLVRPLRSSSVHQLTTTLRVLDRWHGRHVRLEQLSAHLVNRFLRDHAVDHAPKTVSRRRGDLLTLWRFAAAMNLVDPPPKHIRQVTQPRRIPRAWTRDEMSRMLDAADRAQEYYRTGIRIGAFWTVFILLVYDTGLRLSDVLALTLAEVQTGEFEVAQEKTGEAIICRVQEVTLAAIAKTVPPQREKLLPWPYCREYFWKHWKEHVLLPAGLPVGRKEGPQKLRRTSASHLEAVAPGAAMRHLGHRTPGLAQQHYIDPRIAGSRPPLPPSLLG